MTAMNKLANTTGTLSGDLAKVRSEQEQKQAEAWRAAKSCGVAIAFALLMAALVVFVGGVHTRHPITGAQTSTMFSFLVWWWGFSAAGFAVAFWFRQA